MLFAPFMTLAVVLVVLSCCQEVVLSAAAPSVRVGFITSFKEKKDPNIVAALSYFLDGINAATNGVNAEGGINGRVLEVVTCDAAYSEVEIEACVVNLTATPRLVAFLPIISDRSFNHVLPLLRSSGALVFGPMITQSHPFDTSFILLHVDTRLQILSLVKMAVNKGHNKRIGLVWSNNSGVGSTYVGDTRSILQTLGMDLVGWYSVDFYSSGFKWKDQAYVDFLETMPQVLLFLCPLVQSSAEFLMDVMMRSVRGWGVDPNLKILAHDQIAPGIPAVLSTLKLLGIKYEPAGKLFMAMSNPLLMDLRYLATRHAFADLVTLHGGSTSFASNNLGYHLLSMVSWIATRTLTVALRSVQAGNLSRASLRDKVFDTSIFTVDDLVFGPFSGSCTGIRAHLGEVCESNTGYRVVEVYAYNNDSDFTPVDAAQVVTPLMKCNAFRDPVEKPLIYLVARPDDATSTSMVNTMLAGIAAHEQAVNAPLRASLELVVASNASALAADVATAAADKYLSAMVVSVLDPNSIAAEVVLPLVDPITIPAVPALPFKEHIVYLSATLQQEIHALCEYFTVSRSVTSFSVIAVGKQARAIETFVEKSANTFGASVGCSHTSDQQSSAGISLVQGLLAASPMFDPVFLFGVTTVSVVSAVALFLRDHPGVQVLIPFSELSALYDDWVSNLAGIEHQVFFASSLRNWNARSLPSNQESTLMQRYFASTLFGTGNRHPLTLRGFFTSAVMQKLASEVTTAYTASALLDALYSVSVVSVSATDVVGPFFKSNCSSAGDARHMCETNIGAREVFVMSVADVTIGASRLSHYQSTTVFSSSVVEYQSLLISNKSSALSSQVLVYIFITVAVFLIALVAFNKLRRSSRFKLLMMQGLWVVCFRVIVHVGSIVLHVFSCIAVFQASDSATFSAFYIILTGMASLACFGEAVVLVVYFTALVEANSDLSEDAMLAWDVAIAKAALVSLSAEQLPMTAIAFVALLRIDASVAVLISFATSCFFAGTKVHFLQGVFSTVLRKLKHRLIEERRFKTLREVATFVRLIIRTTGWSMRESTLGHDSSLAEISAFREKFGLANPDRFKEVRQSAKQIAIELKKLDVNADEFFGIVKPYLANSFDPSYGPALAQSEGTHLKRRSTLLQFSLRANGNPLFAAHRAEDDTGLRRETDTRSIGSTGTCAFLVNAVQHEEQLNLFDASEIFQERT